MRASIVGAARRVRNSSAVTLCALSAALVAQVPPERELVTRAHVVGNSAEVRQMIKEGASQHRTTLGDHRRTAEYGKVPPACGLRVRQKFADFCMTELNIGLTPCEASEHDVNCSTEYLTPRSERVYWRLRYHHTPDQASLELQALSRADGGRTTEVVSTKTLDKLYQQLLKVSQCTN
jgi:hypothetical protein